MTQAASPRASDARRERRPWARPCLVSTTAPGAPLLLCASNTPVSCFGGNCCDVSTSCDYICQGQGG